MRRFVLFIFLLLLLAGAALKWAYNTLQQPLPLHGAQVLDVQAGDTVYRLVNNLQQAQLLSYPQLLVLYSRLLDLTQIKAGEYQLTPGMTAIDVLHKVLQGQVINHPVTFLEGVSVFAVVENLQNQLGIIRTVNVKDNQALLVAMGADKRFTHAEGLLLPETYHYTRGTKDSALLKRAHQALLPILDSAWEQAHAKKLPYKNAYELLIMASIIERETAVNAERAQIAGVFVTRLQKKMRLQTDPTVIYGMGEDYKGKISRADLRKPTPYNTYTIQGLPPTPIALASKASIEAAANPLLNDKLYFVAKGDGSHYFSSTLEEHNRAVKQYQLNRRADYRSTPEAQK